MSTLRYAALRRLGVAQARITATGRVAWARLTPIAIAIESALDMLCLREDGGYELREDGSYALRE